MDIMGIIDTIANCIMALAALAIFIFSIYIYKKQRPRIEVRLLDEKGLQGNSCYYAKITGISQQRYFYVIFFKLSIFQYVILSQLTNIRISISKRNEVIGTKGIGDLALKWPDEIPREKKSFASFLNGISESNLLKGKTSEYLIEGCMSKEMVAIFSSEILFSDSETDDISIGFSFSIGVKDFGPYNLKVVKLFD